MDDMPEIECPHCGEKELLEFGVGHMYGMELEYWTCFTCLKDFGGDLDSGGELVDDRGNEP